MVYSKANCPQCVTAKNRLEAAGIAFTEVKVDQDKIAHQFLVSEGHRSVPQLYLNGKSVNLTEVLSNA